MKTSSLALDIIHIYHFIHIYQVVAQINGRCYRRNILVGQRRNYQWSVLKTWRSFNNLKNLFSIKEYFCIWKGWKGLYGPYAKNVTHMIFFFSNGQVR